MAEEAGLDLGSLIGHRPARADRARGCGARHCERAESMRERESRRAPLPHSPTLPRRPLASQRALSPSPASAALIAERMAASHSQTAPVTLTAEADATALVELRKQLAADGVAVSYNDLLLYVLARALREHPRLNATLEGDAIKLWRRIDIGLAVDTDRGLLVPVVRDVASKGLAQLAAETQALAERARAGRVYAGRVERRHLHADQPGHVRHRCLHAAHQPAGDRHPGRRPHQGAAGRRGRSDRARGRPSG